MKKLLTLVFCMASIISSLAQNTFCDKEKEAAAIIKKHGSNRLQIAARRYWQLRCKCANGQIGDEAGADYAVRNANEMHDLFYDHMKSYGAADYIPRSLYPEKKISMQDCWKTGGTNAGMNSPDVSGCSNAIPSQFNKPGQAYSYAKQFYQAKCICEAGVPSKEREQQLLATMEISLKHYNDFKTPADPLLMSSASFQSIKSQGCMALSGSNTPNAMATDPDKGLWINENFKGLLNDLAAESNDPYFRKMVEGMNENHEWVSKYKNLGIQHGYLDQSDIEFYNTTENIAQAVKVGEFIYNKIQQKKVEKEEERRRLAMIKYESDQYIQQINRFLNKMYDEAALVPSANERSQNELKIIRSTPSRFKLYNTYTASHRLLVIRYLESPYLLTVQDIKKIQTEIEERQQKEGVQVILQEIEEITKGDNWYDEYYPFLLNDNKAFTDSYNKMYFEIAEIYRHLGKQDSVDYYESKINLEITPETATRLSAQAYHNKNYNLVIKFAPVISTYFMQQGPRASYPEVQYDYAGGLHTSEISFDKVIFMECLHVISLVRTGQTENAETELERIKTFLASLETRVQAKANYKKGRSDEYSDQIAINARGDELSRNSRIYIDFAESILEAKRGNYETSLSVLRSILEKSNVVLDLAANSDLSATDIRFEYISVLIKAGQFEKAKDECYALMRSDLGGLNMKKHNLLNEVKFYQAFLELKTNNTDKALSIIQYLEALGDVRPKVYKLKADIYALKGEEADMHEALESYRLSLHSQP